MATVTLNSKLNIVVDAVCVFFQQKFDDVKTAYANYKVYSRTMQELSSLTDRDLYDISISRSDIKRLAKEAAYGV